MAKAFFRFLRGELNGFYIQSLNSTLNDFSEDIKKDLIAFNNQQFEIGQMTAQTFYNIGKFAGVYPVWLITSDFFGNLLMTESEKVQNKERSERGLLSRDTETFNFYHTEQDDYDDDINTLATTDDKSSLVNDGATLRGYIDSAATDVYDTEGNVKADKILSAPPSDSAYSNFYGNQFLVLEDNSIAIKVAINLPMFYALFTTMQDIRYNGVSIDALCRIIENICPDRFMTIRSIEKMSNLTAMKVVYSVDYNMDIMYKAQRTALVLYIVKLKFPQIVMEEYIGEENG